MFPLVHLGARDPLRSPSVTRVLRTRTLQTPPRATTTPCNFVISRKVKWGGLNSPGTLVALKNTQVEGKGTRASVYCMLCAGYLGRSIELSQHLIQVVLGSLFSKSQRNSLLRGDRDDKWNYKPSLSHPRIWALCGSTSLVLNLPSMSHGRW